MTIDWHTTLASGGVGAAAGALTSWVAAPHLVNRQESGRKYSDARQVIREIVGPELTKIRQYQALARSSLGRDPEKKISHDAEDITLCATILTASAGLTRSRRWLVTRRLQRLFGSTTVELCGLHGESAGDPEAVIGILLNRWLNARDYPERFKQPEPGEWDTALRSPHDSRQIDNLLKSLKRLGESR